MASDSSTGLQDMRLGIFCDRFPNILTGFLVTEYNAYLEAFPLARVWSLGRDPFRPLPYQEFDRHLEAYRALYPALADRIHRLAVDLEPAGEGPHAASHVRLSTPGARFRRPDLAYAVFAMNAAMFTPTFDALGLPFAFTLYPGGGFQIGGAQCEARLQRVFSSPNFRSVFTNSRVTTDYLSDRFGLGPDKVRTIPGGTVPIPAYAPYAAARRRYGVDKDTLDVCFVASRYTPRGLDKGYDVFVQAARVLAPRFPHLRFHVVGGFDETVLDVSDLGDRMVFHGKQPTHWLGPFFAGMDAFLSANRPWLVAAGEFDGFPTTACVEAGATGVALFASDPLDQNVFFSDGRDIVIVPADGEQAAAALEPWLRDPDRLAALGAAGRLTIERNFGAAAQLRPRIEHLADLMDRERAR